MSEWKAGARDARAASLVALCSALLVAHSAVAASPREGSAIRVADAAASPPESLVVQVAQGATSPSGAPESLIIQAPDSESESPPAPRAAGEVPEETSVPKEQGEPRAGEQKAVTLQQAPASAVVLRSDRRAMNVDLTGRGVALRKGDLLVTRTKSEPRVLSQPQGAATPTRIELPYQMRFMDEDGEARTSKLVAEVGGGGFRISSEGSTFAAQLFVALVDAEEPAARYDLPQPVQVLVTGAVDRVSPDLFDIQRTNAWSTIGLEARAVPERVPVKIRASIDPVGLELSLQVTRPDLVVAAHPSVIQGFGLESTEVLVKAEGLPKAKGQVVLLSAERGRLSETELVLDEQGVAKTELRSTGTGPVVVAARGPAATSATSTVRFQWPVRFLLVATLGGAIGAFAGELRGGGLRSKRPIRVALDVLGGVLLGLVVAVAYAAGISLLALELPPTGGEALVFTVAALGALGIALKLPKLTKTATQPSP